MKCFNYISLAILLFLAGVSATITLTQPPEALALPGRSITLTCTVSGYDINNHHLSWIRQYDGKALVFITSFRTGYTTHTADEFKGRVTPSTHGPTGQLRIDALKVEDTATYYCAREGYPDLDYWGKGTLVTVTSESPKAPSLFPLIPSGDNSGTSEITIGCLAKNFLPDSVDFSWNNPNNQSIGNQNYMKFPSILSGGTYTTASQAKVSRSTWDQYENFYCKAEHPQGVRVVPVVRPYVGDRREPKMLIRAPVLAAFSNIYLNSTVTCEVSDLCSGNIAISWLKEQQEITTGVTTSKPVPNGRGGYTIWSKLVITKEDWFSQKTFACVAKSKEYNHSESFSLENFCKSPGCLPVTVETIPPSYADTSLSDSAKLTCRISNIPTEADYSKLNVTWTRASDHKQLHTVMTDFLEQDNEFYYVDAVATVCATEWKVDETFTCKVAFEDVLVKPVEKTLKKEIDGEPKAPSVYILSPSLEELNLRETVTLTCLIKHFNPGDYFVRWLQNEQPVSESAYYTSKAILESKAQQPKQYFAYSMLTVNEQEWSAGDSFTCMVGHEALPYNATQKTINKNTGKPSIVNVSLVLSDTSNPCY